MIHENQSERVAPSTAAVLLVDDEPGIQKLVQRYLERRGISVLVASCGEEALQAFEREHQRIALLITDMMMPGMSGYDLALRLRAKNAALPIVFISGFSDQFPDQNTGFTCMPKPLDLSSLAQQVQKCLAA